MELLDKLGLKQIFSKTARLKHRADYRQSVADRSEEGVAVMEIDGTLQFVNGAWASMHGYKDRDELIGRNIKHLYAGRAMDDFNRFVAQTKLLGWYIATIEQSRKDRTSFPAQLKMAVLKDDSAKPSAILLIVSDLSHLSRMNKMIQQNTEELETLKTRLGRLEEAIARRNQPVGVVCETSEESNHKGLPVAELKQLSEIAKRFR
ncbi:MAG: PAS domain-containing protein [Planctomycetota bacterium]